MRHSPTRAFVFPPVSSSNLMVQCLHVIEKLDLAERPLDISGHSPDPKCRFFYKMSETPPYETAYPGLNAANVVPSAEHIKSRWTPTMDKWGTSMKRAYVAFLLYIRHLMSFSVEDLTKMTSIGLGLPADDFRNAGRYGLVTSPH